jgi:hypothetical protein
LHGGPLDVINSLWWRHNISCISFLTRSSKDRSGQSFDFPAELGADFCSGLGVCGAAQSIGTSL